MSTLADFEELLRQDADEGFFATGIQIFAAVNGTPLISAAFGVDGLGREITTDRVHRIHCAGKPLTALAIGALVDDGELSFHDQIGNVLEIGLSVELFDITIDELLCHRAGLSHLSARDTDMMRPHRRRQLLLDLTPLKRGKPVYSNFSGWHLLGMAIETLTGMTARDYIHQRVLDPIGVSKEIYIGLTQADRAELGYEPAPSVSLEGQSPVPILIEVLDEIVATCEVANMTFATMRGCAAVYTHLLGIVDGETTGVISNDSLTHLITPTGPAAYDPKMGRTCRYGHGFMVDLAGHDFGQLCSPASFGHSGYRGTTAAFADPASGLVVAMYYNGATDAESTIGYLRNARFDQLQRIVGEIA